MLLRQAISLARRLQDPLVEFSQLCSTDEEIMCLRYHTLQVNVDVFFKKVVFKNMNCVNIQIFTTCV